MMMISLLLDTDIIPGRWMTTYRNNWEEQDPAWWFFSSEDGWLLKCLNNICLFVVEV